MRSPCARRAPRAGNIVRGAEDHIVVLEPAVYLALLDWVATLPGFDRRQPRSLGGRI
jgi:hypothetical protein